MSKAPKLYKADGMQGYRYEDLKKDFVGRGLWEAFSKWYVGQTGIIIDGYMVVYKHDVERFLLGKPDLDIWP